MILARFRVVLASTILTAACSPAAADCQQDSPCGLRGSCRLPCLPESLAPTVGRTSSADGSSWVSDAPARPHRYAATARRPTKDRGARPVAATASSVSRPSGRERPDPVLVVTVAADEAEADRLRALRTTMTEGPVRIARVAADGRDADAYVDTSVGAGASLKPGRDARLFSEDLHVVAAKDVRSIGELAGKVVSFGPEGGASQAAARRAFSTLAVKVEETPLDLDNALDGVASGDVAAVVVLAPPPFARLTGVSGGAHLLPFPEPAMPPSGMSVVAIPAGTYPGLSSGDVRTFAVDAILRASAKDDGPARALVAEMAKRTDALSRRGFDLLKAESGKGASLAASTR